MSDLPVGTTLGQLEIVEVYEFYDRPVLFACRNMADNLYLVVLEAEDKEADTWLYVSISQTRFEHIRSGGIDLYTAFKQPEDNYVLEVIIPRNGQPIYLNVVEPETLTEEQLPMQGERLNLETQTRPALEQDISRKAQQSRREHINLGLEFADKTRTEAPAKPLGEILQYLQEFVISIVQRTLENYQTERKRKKGLAEEVELAVLNLSASSFAVELASSEPVNMFGDSLVGDAFEELISILNTGSEIDQLKERLTKYQPVVATNYLHLLRALSKSNIDYTYLTWASPKPGRGGTARLSSPVVFQIIDALKEWRERTSRDFEVTGRLIGANIRTKSFEIETREGKISGVISSDINVEAFETISNATLSRRYVASIREVTTTNIATGEVSITNQLLQLREPSPAHSQPLPEKTK